MYPLSINSSPKPNNPPHKTGVLLINLGTPDNCDRKSVRRYLKQFLSDPRVIDLAKFPRWLLVNLLILPFRSKKSAAAYQQIWQAEGSPLLTNSLQLKEALQQQLPANYQVALGMRYGNPSIATAIAELQGCSRLMILPLFPQYSSAATGSAIQSALDEIKNHWNIPEVQIQRDFYSDPGFIAAYARVIKNTLQNSAFDKIIFSYHGLPERHLRKSQCQEVCKTSACPTITEKNRFCYRAQCFATTTLLAQALNLSPDQFVTAFQSRLGRTPWIKPYTDHLLPQLIKQKVKNIAVVCPSFVADCLETLEEVNIRMREQWRGLGGQEFTFIPCLNADSQWVENLVKF